MTKAFYRPTNLVRR